MKKQIVSIFLFSILASCTFFLPRNPFIGTWVFTSSDTVYDANFVLNTIYTEETLTFDADGTLTFSAVYENFTYGGRVIIAGNGTYVYDDTSFSVNIDLTVNQVSEATSVILSGSYVISGIAMTITDSFGSFTYYKQ